MSFIDGSKNFLRGAALGLGIAASTIETGCATNLSETHEAGLEHLKNPGETRLPQLDYPRTNEEITSRRLMVKILDQVFTFSASYKTIRNSAPAPAEEESPEYLAMVALSDKGQNERRYWDPPFGSPPADWNIMSALVDIEKNLQTEAKKGPESELLLKDQAALKKYVMALNDARKERKTEKGKKKFIYLLQLIDEQVAMANPDYKYPKHLLSNGEPVPEGEPSDRERNVYKNTEE